MKSTYFASVVMAFALSTVAAAQAGHEAATHASPSAAAAESVPDKAFAQLKALAGTWEGRVNTSPATPDVENQSAQITFRVASMGHTLMHEMTLAGRPDHPITMLVVDGNRLLLTHYCDADNRPRMAGSVSPDGKTITFEMIDISGNLQSGHMQRAVFTLLDANHHLEDWTFMMPGDVPVRAHFDLQRTGGSSTSGN